MHRVTSTGLSGLSVFKLSSQPIILWATTSPLLRDAATPKLRGVSGKGGGCSSSTGEGEAAAGATAAAAAAAGMEWNGMEWNEMGKGVDIDVQPPPPSPTPSPAMHSRSCESMP
ncbi:hypothetical protein M0804_012867 [Polistes exclamans]|nr:hypothetical protein M0804_012867 [Polistes exclamans]